jgi:TonB family protein
LGERGSLTGGGGRPEALGGGLGLRGSGEGYGPGGAKEEGQLDLRTEPPLVLGGLDRALIDEVVKRHLSALRYCYQRELARQPTLAGKVSVRFVIARDGKVSDVRRASSSLQHEGVEACVHDRFRRMAFPPPLGGVVVVTYPLMFSPG